jgi:hypothetical protein
MTKLTMPALAVLGLTYALAGCDTRSPDGLPAPPVAPTVRPEPASPVAGERWNLTGTYAGHTGPAECIQPFDGNVRPPENSVLVIYRSGESITLVTDHNRYVGLLVAENFSASDSDDSGASWQCGAAQIRYRLEGQVSGRFSADGRTLTGKEFALARLASGETVTRQWDWSATRQ